MRAIASSSSLAVSKNGCPYFSRCHRRLYSSSSSISTKLFSWGTDNDGSLLLPEIESGKKVDVPEEVKDWKSLLRDADGGTAKIGDDVKIESIVSGPTDTAIILSDARCYVCGKNGNGQLGLGHKNAVSKPTLLADDVKSIALGSNFSAYIDKEGDLYTFGFGGSTFSGLGFLGHGNGETYLSPKLVESLIEDNVFAKQVYVGDSHLTVLTTEGEVLSCGAGSYGRLGNFETTDQLYLEPVELLTSGVTSLSGGKSFTMALKDDGILYGWGRNHKGQIGTGLGLAVDMYAMEPIPAPIEADELVGRQVTHVSAGSSHAACITQGGELFYWGMSLYLEPVPVTTLLHTPVVDVNCGLDYTLATTEDGKLYSFGRGKTGVLGQGPSVKTSNQPQLMEALEDYNVKSVSAGWNHAFALVDEK